MKQVLNGHTGVLNALRETQVEHGRRLDGLGTKLESLDGRVGSLEAKVDSGFTKVNVGMDRITRLLQQVVDKN